MSAVAKVPNPQPPATALASSTTVIENKEKLIQTYIKEKSPK